MAGGSPGDDLRHMDFSHVFSCMLESYAQDGPIGAKAHAIWPLDEDNSGLLEQVFETERVEIMGVGDAIQIHMKYFHISAERMNQSKRGAGDILFARGAQAADYALSESRFARAQLACEENKERQLDLRGQFSTPRDGLFAGMSDNLAFRHDR